MATDRAENRRYAMMIVMSRDQIKEILDRVLTWPPERHADAASVLTEMEAQDASPLQLDDEQVAEVTRRLADPNPKFVMLESVTFYNRDGHNIFGRGMVARWANLPQPVPIPVATQSGAQFNYFDLDSFNRESRMDIYPGENEPLDIAVRIDTDTDCYAWNNDVYIHPDGARNPDWKLGPGVYLAKVTINVSGRPNTSYFRVHNEGPRSSFRLEAAAETEIKRVEAAGR
jgi:hypothetical protein